jgi:uncharacterized protein YjbI with pentapeptide repeats
MAREGKNRRNDGPAQGWDLFKWRWVTEPPVGLTAAVYGILFIIFFFIAVSGIVALWQLLAPIWISASPASSSTGADWGAELRGRLLIIGALLTTPFLIWRLIVGHWAARIAQETARNTLFAKAIEQLGATREEKRSLEVKGHRPGFRDETRTVANVEVRLGAIYALEKLARDDLEMHWPIMETLCAYIRENAGPPRPPPERMVALLAKEDSKFSDDEKTELSSHWEGLRPPAVDVQAAISVIGRRGERQLNQERRQRGEGARDAWRLNLADCHLACANFADLDFAAPRLGGSILAGADLSDANFEDGQHYGARFEGAFLDRIHLAHAKLDGAHFEGARLDDAHLEGASLHDAHLEGSTLRGAHLDGAWLASAHLEGANLIGTHLEGAFLWGAHLEGASLKGAWLQRAQLDLAHLEGAGFQNAYLERASLEGAILVDANLDGADLGETNVDQPQTESAWGGGREDKASGPL